MSLYGSRTMTSIHSCCPAVLRDEGTAPDILRRWLNEASFVLAGIGAGFSASAGLNYLDENFFRTCFPAHAASGIRSAWEAVGRYWDPVPGKETEYWGYWARHIHVMRYEPPCLPAYADLANVIRKKDWFILSTNADGQTHKTGLDETRIFTPQGDYSLFQCSLPCREEVWNNRKEVERMLERMPDPLHIREQDVPRCPHCGRLAVPNLRKDDSFVDTLYREGHPRYRAFLDRALEDPGRLLLLELGVGFNTPGIIRLPFERLAETTAARLIRLNLKDAALSEKIGDNGVGLALDAAVLRRISHETNIGKFD